MMLGGNNRTWIVATAAVLLVALGVSVLLLFIY
jgi:hypothetical protein